MKSSGAFLKVITISGFTLLIICFVAYRAGAFESFMNPSSAIVTGSLDGPTVQTAVDTPRVVTVDSFFIDENEIMSSSKSMVIYKQPVKTDSAKKQTGAKTDSAKVDTKPKMIMGSSKSGFIYHPEPKSDTSKKPK